MFIFHPAKTQHSLCRQRDFSLHIRKLALNQLIGGQGPAELLAIQYILPGGMPAGFSRAQHSPGDAITSGIQAGERPLQSTDIWKSVFFRHKDLVHHDHAGDGGPQPNLAVNGGAVRPFMPLSRIKPRISSASSLAQTTKTSAMGLLEIQVFEPVSK